MSTHTHHPHHAPPPATPPLLPLHLIPSDLASYSDIAAMIASQRDWPRCPDRSCKQVLEHDSTGLFCHNPRCHYYGYCPPSVCVTHTR